MRRALTALCGLALLSPLAASAVPLFSDNFDSEALALNTALVNWTVSDGTIDVIGAANFFDFYPGNGRYLDLDGSSGNAGRITTNTVFSLLAGTYTLSFQLGGSTRGDTNTVNIALGSIFSEAISLNSDAGLLNFSRTITLGSAAASGALSFENLGGDNLGLILDDVQLDYRAPTTVPEPSTLALLSLGGFLAAARRRSLQR